MTASYGYDADGRRVSQTFNGQVTNSLWDEASPYGDVVLETNSSGTTLASYVLGGTGLLSQTRSGTTSYFLQDGQGSTRALTNGSGTVTDTYSYTAFGELFNHTGSTTNSYLYTGQQYDSLTGLYSLRARYYNPALGRFLSQDTYPYNFSNPIELNRYVYTANNPINMADPSGHWGVVDFGLLVQNAVRGATAGAAVGFYAGAVYGIVASIFCGDGVGAGAWGLRSAIMHPSDNYWCNFLNIGMSVASIALGAASMPSYWGGGGWQLCGATCGGGTSSITLAGQGVAGNSGVWGALGSLGMMSRGGGDSLSPQARFLLKKLRSPGSTFTLPRGPIDLDILLRTMAELQEYTSDEFMLVRVSSGDILIVRGVSSGQQGAFVYAPPDTVNIIAHTHPESLSNIPTRLDFEALRALEQDSSIIITYYGGPRRFYLSDDYWQNP